MNCGARVRAMFFLCRSRREAPLVLPTSRQALLTANNAPWRHCSSSDLRSSAWRAALALSANLLAHALTQLPNWFERIFDQRASPDNDVRFSFHSNAQRQDLARTRVDRGSIE